MKKFAIYGTIVDTDIDRETVEDATPGQFRSFIKTLGKNEPLEVEINSPGGSVTAGITIANLIKQLNTEGHETTAVVEGLAASIASVIMCACKNVVMNESSMVMIHKCWSIAIGNSDTMRKEADTMDMMNKAIISFYRSKFDLSDEQLEEYMRQETWFSGSETSTFNFNCKVVPDERDFAIAACIKNFDLSKFNKLPTKIKDIIEKNNLTTKSIIDMENTDKETTVQQEVQEAVIEAEEKIETQVEEPKAEVVEETVPKAEVDKRVSGMQSAMAKQMDAMKKDYEAKIEDFKVQMKVKDEELAKVKAEATSLKENLDKANGELSDMTSALAEKENALAVLNAGVNTPAEQTNWKALKGKAFFDWYAKTH